MTRSVDLRNTISRIQPHRGLMNQREIKKLSTRIEAIRKAASELLRFSGGIQAVDRNVLRILASVKMLEINISDLLQSRPKHKARRV